ncbi:GAF domain-containing protein [Streptomyces sp. M19]
MEIGVEGDVLTLRAERTEKTEDRYHSEFRYGTFARSVRLPAGARGEDATADYRDGVLTITVPLPRRRRAPRPSGSSAVEGRATSPAGAAQGLGPPVVGTRGGPTCPPTADAAEPGLPRAGVLATVTVTGCEDCPCRREGTRMKQERMADAGGLPRLRLDELLEELHGRITAVRGTRDRVHGLLEAVLSVGRALELSEVLRRVVEAAVVLVDAEYGALGVIGEDRTLTEFITVGLDEEGRRPSGRCRPATASSGADPAPRAAAPRGAVGPPASYGFPAHHPPMRTFLGVPIRVREEVFGNLYLTERRGGQEFDAEDEAVLSTLAVAAGVAIDNARLYEEVRRREQWLEANAEVTRGLLSGMPESRALEVIVGHARRILVADLGVLALPVPDSDELWTALASGRDAETHRGLRLPRRARSRASPWPRPNRSPARRSPRTRGSRRVRAGGTGSAPRSRCRCGPPTGARRAPARPRGGQGRLHHGPDRTLLAFADQAALAMELAERRRDAERVAVFADRDRIARDLHDLAIQRLFAAGMTLQSTVRFVERPEGRNGCSGWWTTSTTPSRSSGRPSSASAPGRGPGRPRPAGPGRPRGRGGGARARLHALAAHRGPGGHRRAPVHGRPRRRGARGGAVNIARHAGASAAGIVLVVGATELTLTVMDNGTGLPRNARRSGLRNLAQRAEELGGDLTLDAPTTGGTRLVCASRSPAPTDAPPGERRQNSAPSISRITAHDSWSSSEP